MVPHESAEAPRACSVRRGPHGVGWLLLAIATGGSGCYSLHDIRPEALERLEAPAVCHIELHDGTVTRAVIEPGMVTPEAIRCYPCSFTAQEWATRYSSWPAVYSWGRYWRWEATSSSVVLPRDDVERVSLEDLDWTWTIVSAPLSLPAGAVDFLVDNVQLGFEAVNDRFDTFSAPPATQRYAADTPRP